MPDALFADPRLARLYDVFDDDRSDLDAYEAMVAEFGAASVLDVGCGTGSLAVRLAALGIEVVGLDPATASLEVASGKEHADRVRWIEGDATSLPPLQVDLAVMTGNVAQVFLTDEAWATTLVGIRTAVGPGGRFVFETRDPAKRAWEGWTADKRRAVRDVPGVGRVEVWSDLLDVDLPLVSFRHSYRFESTGEVLTSDSTLRFPELDEIEASLASTGWAMREVRDAPDRPGLEWVVVAEAAEPA